MKKLLSILLALAMVFSFAACGKASGIPGENLKTLNEIFKDGYEVNGTMAYDYLFVQTVVNKKGNEYVAIVKVPEELRDAFQSIDFTGENAQQQYLDLIGDLELTDVLDVATVAPDKETLNSYKNMTISEFEALGANMMGCSGDNGKYTFDFEDDTCRYRVVLQDAKIDDLDDMDQFNAAIQDKKIKSVECNGLASLYVEHYLEQFFEAPPKAGPKEMGETKSSLDEINAAVGSKIKAASGATEEKYNLIDGKIAQYIYKSGDYYYCVRSSADTNIDLAADDFSEYPLVDEEGYVTIASRTSDETNSVRFVFDNYQYAFIVYDNGELDWSGFDALQSEFTDSICEYPEGSVFKSIIGTHMSEDSQAAMSISPVSSDSAQATIMTSADGVTKLWTMIVKANGNKLTYSKAKYEEYKEGGSTASSTGKGEIVVKDGSLVWNKMVFK